MSHFFRDFPTNSELNVPPDVDELDADVDGADVEAHRADVALEGEPALPLAKVEAGVHPGDVQEAVVPVIGLGQSRVDHAGGIVVVLLVVVGRLQADRVAVGSERLENSMLICFHDAL